MFYYKSKDVGPTSGRIHESQNCFWLYVCRIKFFLITSEDKIQYNDAMLQWASAETENPVWDTTSAPQSLRIFPSDSRWPSRPPGPESFKVSRQTKHEDLDILRYMCCISLKAAKNTSIGTKRAKYTCKSILRKPCKTLRVIEERRKLFHESWNCQIKLVESKNVFLKYFEIFKCRS